MNEANYGKCRDLSVIWEFSKKPAPILPLSTFLLSHLEHFSYNN